MNKQSTYRSIEKRRISIAFIFVCILAAPIYADPNTDLMNSTPVIDLMNTLPNVDLMNTSGAVTRVVRSHDWQVSGKPANNENNNNKQDQRSHSFFNDAQFRNAANAVLNSDDSRPVRRVKKIRYKKRRLKKNTRASLKSSQNIKTEADKSIPTVEPLVQKVESSVTPLVVEKVELTPKEIITKPIKNKARPKTPWKTMGQSLPQLLKELSN